MSDAPVSERICRAMNAHDPDAFAACFIAAYRSEQPVHPDRTFTGADVVRANWSTIFRDVPDLRAELLRSIAGDAEEWGEWRFHGGRRDGSVMDMRGVMIFGISDGLVEWGRLYIELVQEEGAGIDAMVEQMARGRDD